MTWKRVINIVRVFKKTQEEEDDDAMSFVCIGLPPDSDSDASSISDSAYDAADWMPEQRPLPDLPWESKHNGVAARPLRSVGRLSITSVRNPESLDTRAMEVHVRAPQNSTRALSDFSTSSSLASRRRADRRLDSQRGLKIDEKSRVNVKEGNRLKLKEICAGYLFEVETSEDEEELNLMFPTITPYTSKCNQEEANLLRLKQVRENFTFSEADLVDELISGMEEAISMVSPANRMKNEDILPAEERLSELTIEGQESTPKHMQTKEEELERVDKCTTSVPSLEFEPIFPVTDYQRRLREETRKALQLTEARRKRTGCRE